MPKVLVRRRDAGGGPPASPPVNTVAPVVSGTARVGQTLTTTDGTWTGTAPITFTYQWQHGTTNIGGQTANTYVIDVAYIGETIRCVVTGHNADGSASANSNASGAVVTNVGTFGKTTTTGAGTQITPNFVIIGGTYALAQSSVVSKLTAYLVGGNNDQNVRCVIYDNTGSAGKAGALKATSVEVAILAHAAAAWVDFTITGGVTLAAGSYYLGTNGGASADPAAIVQDNSTSRWYKANTYPTMPDPYGAETGTDGQGGYALYGTYTF